MEKSKIAIIDADLIGRTQHRFPNLACEKLSGYWRSRGYTVELKTDYENLDEYKQVYVSKVFTDTPYPDELLEHENVITGGTGFYFDNRINLPDEIEHFKPDYNLYDDWIEKEVEIARDKAEKENQVFNEKHYRKKFNAYTDYSIGFLTRGCFRKCGFCVNKEYDHVQLHSPLIEFFDKNRKKICLLDDNFLGCSDWERLLKDLQATNKPFVFKQGLDERLLTDRSCKLLFSSKYDGEYLFAFDNIKDYDLIHEKLKLIRKYYKKDNIRFYVLAGYESVDEKDIESVFKRISLLLRYRCLPYLMRYRGENDIPYKQSKYEGLYNNIARWTNQVQFIKKISFREFCKKNQERVKKKKICKCFKSFLDFEREYPEIAKKYFDVKYGYEKE